MATITTAQSGDYSATATWVGGVLPDPALDTVVVAVGHILTLDDTRSIPATTVEGSLVQGPGVTTTLTGNLTLGNGAGKDGTFTFGAGSVLAQQEFSVVQNNCRILSNATSGAWATVTGTGTWSKGAVYGGVTAPKMEIVPRYVSFQTTGAILFPQGTSASGGAGITQKTDIQHCAFVGTGAITHGVAGISTVTAPITMSNNDIRDITGNILFYDTGADPGATVKLFQNNTLSQTTTARQLALTWGFDTSGTVMDNFYAISALAGNHIHYEKMFMHQRDQASGGVLLTLRNNNSIASQLINSYLHGATSAPNSHGINTGAYLGKIIVQNNIFEFLGTEPNIVNYSPNTFLDVLGNLVIGNTTNSLVTAGSTSSTGILNIKNNTQKSSYGAAHGLFISENSPSFTSELNISSNLVQKNSATAPFTAVCNLIANTLNITNNLNNATIAADAAGAYSNIDAIGTDSGNLYGIDAQFIDSTRNLATWGATVGADGTATGAVANLLAINGYNATTKTQSDTPSGVNIAGTPTSLVDWVRAGFAPQNPALKATGEGGVDIGAVPVQVPKKKNKPGFGFRFGRCFGF